MGIFFIFIQGQQILKLTKFAFDGKRIEINKQKPVDDFFQKKKNIVLVPTETTGTNETQLSDNSANSKEMNFVAGEDNESTFPCILVPIERRARNVQYITGMIMNHTCKCCLKI